MASKYRVRVYCHTFEHPCNHVPPHPFFLPDWYDSIRAANDAGEPFIGQFDDDELEWEVLDESGVTVC